jgi:hypothetical protein
LALLLSAVPIGRRAALEEKEDSQGGERADA